MNSVVAAVMNAAITNARRHADPAQMLTGLVLGLRRLRSSIDTEADFAEIAMFDTALREVILAENLKRRRSPERAFDPEALPPLDQGQGARLAAAIIGDAVASCMTLQGEDAETLTTSLGVLATHMLSIADRPLDWESVLAEVTSPEASVGIYVPQPASISYLN